MSWNSKLMGEVVDLKQGFCINKKSNHLVVDEGIPLLRITDMINSQQKIFISPEIPKKFIANKNKQLDELLKKINPLIIEYMSDNSIELILSKKSVYLGKTELDITENILKIINENFK